MSAFKILSLSSLIIMCHSVSPYSVILFEVYWTSWIFIFTSFTKVGTFSAIMSSNILSALSSPADTSQCKKLVCLVVSHRFLLVHLNLISVSRLGNFHCFTFKYADSFFYLYTHLLILLVNVSFQFLYFSAPDFYFS